MHDNLDLNNPDLESRPTPPAAAKVSYEQFLERADESAHVEWVDGEVVPMAPVSNEHQEVSVFLLRLLGDFVESRKLGVIRYEPFQMKTGPELPGRAPDLLFVARENLARLKPNYLEGPADLAVEIVSPESRKRDKGEKLYEYQEGGVREYWLIDPDRKQATFYLLGEDRTYRPATLAPQGVFHSQVLRPLHLCVDWLWQRPTPSVRDVLEEIERQRL